MYTLADGFDRFYKKQNKKPQFKSKKNPVQSYTTKAVNGNIRIEGNTIKLPKLGTIRFAKSREVIGVIKRVTIRQNAAGKYFISVLAEVEEKAYAENPKCLWYRYGTQKLLNVVRWYGSCQSTLFCST